MTLASVALWLLLAVVPVQASGPRPPAQESCTICHGQQAVELGRSVHAGVGFTCVSCHGGVATASEASKAHAGDFRPLDDPRASVAACGECHSDLARMRFSGLRTDQLALYRTSRHGSILFETGDPDVATCTDCHGGHEIRRAADPAASVHPRNQARTCGTCHADAALMERYGLSADAPDLYARSVHGLAVAAGRQASPACSDCHGHHGALPPRVGEAEQVCGHCHSVVQEQYEKSPHFLLETEVQCVTCHGNHLVHTPSDASFVDQGPGNCSTCHGAADDPALDVAAGMHEDLQRFEARIATSAGKLRQAAGRGLYLDQELGYLGDARGILVRARSLTHAASREELDDLLNRGLGMVDQTEDSLAKLSRLDRDRRLFTAVFFVLTAALAVMLLIYAREIRGTWRALEPARGDAEGDRHVS